MPSALCLRVGISCKAFLHKKLASNLPLFYLGLTYDAASTDNLMKARCDVLASQLEVGKLKIPGVADEANMPDSKPKTMRTPGKTVTPKECGIIEHVMRSTMATGVFHRLC
jgi:hypothetical protein